MEFPGGVMGSLREGPESRVTSVEADGAALLLNIGVHGIFWLMAEN
jgi:hypothetical protein